MSKIEKLVDKSKKLLKEKNYSKVIKTCEQILEIESDNEIALKSIGISYYNLKNFEESEQYLEKAYNNNSTDKEIIKDYSATLYELGKLDKALTLYDFYFDSEEDDRTWEVELYFITLAKKYSQKNRIKDALKCYDYYLDKESDSVPILKSKIELLAHYKRFDDALSCYDELLKISDDGKLYIRSRLDQILCLEAKAFYQYDKGLMDESMDTLKTASDFYMNKYDIGLYVNPWQKHLSNTISKYGDNSEEFFDNLFFVDAEDSMEWCTLIGYFTSRYDSYGDIDIMICDWLLEKNPDSIPILNKKAKLHTNWKPTLSLKLYERILELEEFNNNALKGKLNMLHTLKWYEKAYKFIQSLPNNIEGITDEISDIAKVLTNQGKYSEAIDCYEKILELDPSCISAITSIKKILNKKEMKETKKESKYYMDWIDVIISRNDGRWCNEDGCYERLYHIMHGLNNHVLIEIPNESNELFVKGSIDCDDNSTHYCPKCKKTFNLGVECFNYNREDEVLYQYATKLILAVKHEIYGEGRYGEDLKYLQERLYNDYHIDKREFNAFINKLEKLNYLSRIISLKAF